MNDVLFFDALTRIGPRRHKHPAEAWRLSELLEEMNHCSISGALVGSTLSASYEPMHSNLELSRQIEDYPHLFAAWNVFPHQTGEFPEPSTVGALMREHDVRAVTLYPKANAWDWEADHSDLLLSWLNGKRVLTIVDSPEFDDYRAVDRLLSRYPELPLLLTKISWAHQRFVIPLLRKHRNLHITFDHFQINNGLEYLASIGLEDQLLFGSFAPAMSIGAHRAYIDYAGLPQTSKEKIAGGNLIRLLKGQKPETVRTNHAEDSIMTAARKGEPLPVPVIDMHMHILHEGMDGAGGAYRMEKGGPTGVFEMLSRFGCRGGGFMSWNGVVSADSLAGNACTSQALDAAPKGYWGLANFDPAHYSQSELAHLIPQIYQDKRFIGMKPYHVYGIEYHDSAYDIWWRYGNAHKFYALIHRTRSDYLEVETLAEKYPDVRWVVAHCGGSFKAADGAIAAIKKFPNVYAEITLTPVWLGIVEYLVNGAGADRVLYGSDLPMRDPRQQLGWVIFSRLPLEEKKKVLGANAFDVIRPCWDRLPEHSRPLID